MARRPSVHDKNRNKDRFIAAMAAIALLAVVAVTFEFPKAMSHENDMEFASISDVRYGIGLYSETFEVQLEGLESITSEDDIAALDTIGVLFEMVADADPQYAGQLGERLRLVLEDADGNEITSAIPALTPMTLLEIPSSGNEKTIATFSMKLSREDFGRWSSYRIDTGKVKNGLCCLPEDERSAQVSKAKGSLANVEEQGREALARKEQERQEEARKAREAEEALIESGTVPPRSTFDGDYSDVMMIGDSIMVLTSFSTESALPGVTIDASSGRSLETGGPNEGGGSYDGILDHVRSCDLSYGRYVIGAGNNDGYGMSASAAEEIISILDSKQIWFVTEYVSNNSAGTANTNETIEEMCAKYPNVHKIDWYSLVSNHTEWLQGDNCHPQVSEGREAYATIVKNALDA